MKIRNGFVSNSSSSSFIIAVKKLSTPCKCCGRKDPDILDVLENQSSYSCDNEVRARGVDIISSLKERKDWMVPTEYNLVVEKVKEFLANDEYEVADISISNHSSYLNDMIEEAQSNGIVVIIKKEID